MVYFFKFGKLVKGCVKTTVENQYLLLETNY